VSHAAGQCLGHNGDGVLTPDQCAECALSNNPATRRTRPAPSWAGEPVAGAAVAVRLGRDAAGRRTAMPVARTASAQKSPPCQYLGRLTDRCNQGNIHECRHPERAGKHCSPTLRVRDADTPSCFKCPLYEPNPFAAAAAPKPARPFVEPNQISVADTSDYDGPPVGVAIGSYGMPSVIELGIRAIRHHCGPLPILIVDDCSDGYGHTPDPASVSGQLHRIESSYAGVALFQHPERFGHASGDLSKVWMGVQWAKALRLKYVATLSQRLIFDIPRWLQTAARQLQRSGASTLGREKAREGRIVHRMRSEAMVLDVDQWYRPDVLALIRPRKLTFKLTKHRNADANRTPNWPRVPAERLYWTAIMDYLGGTLEPWGVFGSNRMQKFPGVIWHCTDNRPVYEALAERLGLTMGEYTSRPWWVIEGNHRYQG